MNLTNPHKIVILVVSFARGRAASTGLLHQVTVLYLAVGLRKSYWGSRKAKAGMDVLLGGTVLDPGKTFFIYIASCFLAQNTPRKEAAMTAQTTRELSPQFNEIAKMLANQIPEVQQSVNDGIPLDAIGALAYLVVHDVDGLDEVFEEFNNKYMGEV